MRELAEVSRAETGTAPGLALSAEAAAAVRARLGAAMPEMIEVIGRCLDELAAACAQGYAEASAPAAAERHRGSRRLLDVILSDPPPAAGLVAGLARTAGWVLPGRVAVAVVDGRRPPGALVLPPDVLADWTRPDPCLLVPDPDGPGRRAAVDRALCGWPAAIGPAVPLARAAMSLRSARHALALARAGVIPAGPGPVRCDQHLSTLLILADGELAMTLCGSRLAPLARLRPGQRDRIAETLLAWLQSGENAAAVAQQIHVHPQTVRYRLRQVHELFGDQLRDPDRRFELHLALRIRALAGGPLPAAGSAVGRGARAKSTSFPNPAPAIGLPPSAASGLNSLTR